MAKKNISETDEAADIAVKPARRRKKNVAVETHEIVTRYEVEKPIEKFSSAPEQEIDQEEIDLGAAEEPLSYDAKLERFFEEVQSASSKWEMIVYRLSNYDIDGRTDIRAPRRERVGKLPFNLETYEDEITLNYAKPGLVNIFLPEIRKDGQYHSVLPVLRTSPPSPDEAPGLYVQNAPAPVGAPAAPVDPFAQLEKTLEILAKVRRVIPEPEAPAAAPAAVTTVEQAMLVMMNADGSLVENFANKMQRILKGNGGSHEIGWMELVMEAIKSDTLPKMIKEAKNLLLEANGNAQISQAAPQTIAANGVPPAPPSTPPPIPAPPAEIQLLNFAITACAQNMPPPEAVERIESFASLNPSINPFLDLFVSLPPQEALDWLSKAIPQAAEVTQLPHAKLWIEEVQKIMSADDLDETGESDEHR